MNIWWLVLLSVAVVLLAVLWLRLHALLALLAAGLLVAVLTPPEALERYAARQVERETMTVKAADKFVDSGGASRLAAAFGDTAGQVGILIALASIVGICLMESGAAATIVDRTLAVVGSRRAPEALMVSSFMLGIPVFFDTVFYLMVPLARSLRRTVGRDYVLFILAILAGGSIAHSLVPPTPGPLQVAEIIGIDIGTMMTAGLLIGGCSSILSLAAARLINRWVGVPLRSIGEDAEQPEGDQARADEASAGAFMQGDRKVPGGGFAMAASSGPPLALALAPILLPLILIASRTIWPMLVDTADVSGLGGSIGDAIAMVGDKNVALGIAAVIAMFLLRYAPSADRRRHAVQKALSSGGTIILITAAGGAFGAMLRQAGIADAVADLTDGVPGLALLPIAFLVTASIRTLQGSSTVAMITAAGVLQGFAVAGVLPFHPVYLAMAIGSGSKPISWMTDSGFWVICKMSGMTEAEGLRTVSPMSTAMGFSGLLFTMLGAWLFPLTAG